MTLPDHGDASMAGPGPDRARAGRTDDRTWVLVAYGLMLGGVLIPFAPLAGIILAYIKRGEVAGAVWASHYANLITAFWIALLGVLLGVALTFIFIGLLILGAAVVWFLYRCIRGLVLAIDSKPYPAA